MHENLKVKYIFGEEVSLVILWNFTPAWIAEYICKFVCVNISINIDLNLNTPSLITFTLINNNKINYVLIWYRIFIFRNLLKIKHTYHLIYKSHLFNYLFYYDCFVFVSCCFSNFKNECEIKKLYKRIWYIYYIVLDMIIYILKKNKAKMLFVFL